jgi:CRP-like cAMP-binding protein
MKVNDILKEHLPDDIGTLFYSELEQNCEIIDLKKGDILTRLGDTNNQVYYIINGSIARKVITLNGSEKAIALQSDNFLPFITCLDSFFNQDKSEYLLQASTKATVLKIQYPFIKKSLKSYPSFFKFYNSYIEQYLFFSEMIRTRQLSYTKEDLIVWLMKNYPSLIRDFPSKEVADYIGVTPEWYSKLKRKMFS